MAMLPSQARHEPFALFVAGMDPERFLDLWRPRAVVLSKAFDASVVALARTAKRRSIRVLAVLCDDRSDRARQYELDRALATVADTIVVQTRHMARFVEAEFKRHCAIIEEPLETPAGEPQFMPEDPLRILWFGRSANHDTLRPGLLSIIDDPGLRVTFSIVTEQVTDELRGIARMIAGQRTKALTVSRWSLETQARLLRETDIVVLPSLERRDKWVKGHNRLVEAIRSGVVTLAHPLPAYKELEAFCWCGDDLRAGLTWVMANREEALNRLQRGQAYVEQRFSLARICGLWEQVFRAGVTAGDRAPITAVGCA